MYQPWAPTESFFPQTTSEDLGSRKSKKSSLSTQLTRGGPDATAEVKVPTPANLVRTVSVRQPTATAEWLFATIVTEMEKIGQKVGGE